MTNPALVSVTPLWRGSDIDEDRDPKTPCWRLPTAFKAPPLIVTESERDGLRPPVVLTTLGQCNGGDLVYIGGAAPAHELQLYEVVPP